MQEDKIISALIGLVRACETNPKTPYTDSFVIKALAFPFIEPNNTTSNLEKIIQEIYTEKNTIAPNCAQCTSPCGNTSDYDMQRIFQAEASIRKIKLQILSELQSLAFYLYNHPNQILESEAAVLFLYKALVFISYDREESTFLEILEEAKQFRKETEYV